MDDLVDRSNGHLADERGAGMRPDPLVAIERLGGGYVLAPPTALEILDEDEGGADFAVGNGEWLASSAIIDVEEVR